MFLFWSIKVEIFVSYMKCLIKWKVNTCKSISYAFNSHSIIKRQYSKMNSMKMKMNLPLIYVHFYRWRQFFKWMLEFRVLKQSGSKFRSVCTLCTWVVLSTHSLRYRTWGASKLHCTALWNTLTIIIISAIVENRMEKMSTVRKDINLSNWVVTANS